MTMTPTAAANNIAKVSSWSGTGSQSGVADDPATGADVQISLERGGRGA